jgi:virulence factor
MRNKIGVIGLGDIARKAYLPVITARDIDIHLCSRDEKKLSAIGDQYRISNRHRDIDSLINAGIEAAFVHTATSSHEDIVSQLLSNNIHVYVDKPVTDSYPTTERLVSLAKSKGLILKAGFNRRYAPAYAQLKSVDNPNMIVMQKNRAAQPGDTRTFIFDDFIHVLDTLLFLMHGTPQQIDIKSRSTSGKLNHVVVSFMNASGTTAIGIMNRDNGITEERMEVFSSNEKRVVVNLTDTFIGKDKSEIKLLPDPWQPMLKQRGFEDIIDSFLSEVRSGKVVNSYDDILATHKLCETIIQQLNTQSIS